MVNIDLINLGTGANTGDGDSLRVGAAKINQNFSNVLEFLESLEEDTNEDRLPNVFHVSIDGIAGNVGTSVADSVPSVKEAVELANAYVAANPSQSALVVIHPGQYTEQNPITVKRNISIYGKGLRVVDLVPQNPFESFFLVDSGFKAWGLSIIGMQADSTRQAWCFEFNANADNTGIGASGTGAYILKSPYIQNCSSYTAEDDAGQAGSTSTGSSGGGLKVDGNACAPNSPIRSMVVDSFTQINLGGPGCLVTNDGYAQLVSFFGTFCTYHCKADKGGQVNFTGGTTDFGNYGLVADGYSSEPMYTALATRAHYGASRVQKNFTLNTATDIFTCDAHGLALNDQITFKTLGGSLPAPLTQGTIYYARTITTNTFQVSTTSGGAALNITGSLVGNEDFEFTRQGELYIDADNFTANRIGSDSRPGQGSLLFARLVFPRTGSLAADANTPGTVNSVYEDNGVFYADAVLDTAPAEVGKHEYVKNSGTVVVTRVGTFVDAQGNAIPTTPVAGLNTYTFIVTSVDYNHLTGLTRFSAFNYLPNANDSFYFVNTEYICQQSAMVITSAAPINQFGQVIAENDTTKVGYRIFVYNALNGGLRYPLANNQKLDFRRRSQISAPAHVFEYVGSGTNYAALPENGGLPIQANAYQELNNGRVFISWTNEKGDFGVSNRFLVDGTTGAVTIDASSLSLSGLSAIGPFSRNGGISTVGVQALEISDNINMVSSLGITDINTIPTQTAVVGYVTGFFNGESNITSLRINDVMFYSVQSEAFYPTTRPQLAPLEPGDMLWDASLRTWLGWTGTRFANELDVRVLNNGSKSYNFYQSNTPQFRNAGEPSQSALQNGDRWEKPGTHIAYYNSTRNAWLDLVADKVALSGFVRTQPTAVTVSTFTETTAYLFNGKFRSDGSYVVLTASSAWLSLDYGRTYSQYASYTERNTIGAYDGTITQAGTLLYMLNSATLSRSTDGGSTWSPIYAPVGWASIHQAAIGNRLFLASGQFSTQGIAYSDNDGLTWSAVVPYPALGNKNSFYPRTSTQWVLLLGNVIYYTTNAGVNWTTSNLTPAITNITAVAVDSSDNIWFMTASTLYRTSDLVNYVAISTSITTAQSQFRPASIFFNTNNDMYGTYLGTVFSFTSLRTNISGLPTNIVGRVFVEKIIVSYKVKAGGTAHNASNNMTISFSITNRATDVTTQYNVVLDTPYPSTTTNSEEIFLNATYENGVTLQLSSLSSTGSPSEITTEVYLEGRRIYEL